MKKNSPIQPQPTGYSWLALGLRFLIGGVFIYAGFQKASAPAEEFAAVVEAYGILPPDWTLPFAQIVPWIELIFGVFLVAGYWTRLSARMLAGLLAIFIAALLSAALRKIPLENCGCFGSSVHLSPRIGVFFDACLLASAIWVSRRGTEFWTVDRWVKSGQP